MTPKTKEMPEFPCTGEECIIFTESLDLFA